jgi:hypothetical protein
LVGTALHFFVGKYSISRATADRWWAYAKVWLYCALSGQRKSGNR